jgi:hypothetical protein
LLQYIFACVPRVSDKYQNMVMLIFINGFIVMHTAPICQQSAKGPLILLFTPIL